jgi:hypothetical protein
VPAGVVRFVPTVVGDRDTPDAVRDHLHHRCHTGTDPLRWPCFVAGAVVRNTSSTVYFGVDHVHTDGTSMLLAFHELHTLYQAEVDGVAAGLRDPGDYLDYCTAERQSSATLTRRSADCGRWLDFWLGGPPPTFPLDLGTEPGRSHPSVPVTVDIFDGADADAFAAVCRRHQATFPAGLFAALGIAARDLGGHRSYRGLTVVSTRTEPRWKATQGWFVNLVPVTFPLAGDGDFGQVLGEAQRAFTEGHRLAHVSLIRVAELMRGEFPVRLDAALLPMVSYLDLRTAPGARNWAMADPRVLVGPCDSRDVSMWVNRLRDRTYVCARYPDTPTARANVARYLERLRDILRAVAASDTGRLTRQAAERAGCDRLRSTAIGQSPLVCPQTADN